MQLCCPGARRYDRFPKSPSVQSPRVMRRNPQIHGGSKDRVPFYLDDFVQHGECAHSIRLEAEKYSPRFISLPVAMSAGRSRRVFCRGNAESSANPPWGNAVSRNQARALPARR